MAGKMTFEENVLACLKIEETEEINYKTHKNLFDFIDKQLTRYHNLYRYRRSKKPLSEKNLLTEREFYMMIEIRCFIKLLAPCVNYDKHPNEKLLPYEDILRERCIKLEYMK
jgi:hypothetical protein